MNNFHEFEDYTPRDKSRDRNGWKATRRRQRQAKSKRRAFENLAMGS